MTFPIKSNLPQPTRVYRVGLLVDAAELRGCVDMNLLAEVRKLFAPVLAGFVPDPAQVPDYLDMIKPAANADHGDYQANFAMRLAKVQGKKPPELAKAVVAALPPNDVFESVTVAGPGFINLKLKADWLAAQVRAMAADARLGVAPAESPRKYVIDYSGPNVAKPLHVGHLRSTIIGDALVRLLRFLGHEVIGDNHLGDWGTQFGILLYGYKNHRDEAAFHADPVRELARLYILVRGLFKKEDDEDDEATADDPVKEACRLETAKLHAGDPENVALWKQFMPACLEMLRPIYDRIGVKIDHALGESFYNPMLPGVVEDMLAKGIAVESHGAVVIPNAKGVIPKTEEEQQKEEPPALIRKRDGAYTYTTTDLATIKYRTETWCPNTMLYVVDTRQALHFKTIFAQARRWGYEATEFQHVMFGSILGEDRKPFQTRKGGVAELGDLIDMAVQLALKKYEESYADRKAHGHDVPELTDDVKRDIAEAVGIGAVKYADLSGNRTSDYIFSYDKMLATEGNTGTYMQYAYARCRAIFRKGQIDETRFRTTPPAIVVTHPAERALCLQLLKFEETLQSAATEYLPHYVTGYLWDLAKTFSGLFENCPVLTAETPELRDSRLLLVDLTGRVIHKALDLLGIRTVERM
ncbi:Arginyl-tRNA synthetase [Fimbriiglobus ruber]|uniref:Arginine--tRNA ligase n=1 Tax=Fimbriiglobus ruber TaxID=1908690 RepID=A0A225D4Y3_9BACT|nr:Arginyl-tRNA synthetase [Fimbriiglobus ruber]